MSDVMILNSDQTFDRNLDYLFEKFMHGVNRLNGKKLFKGILEIVVRDVEE